MRNLHFSGSQRDRVSELFALLIGLTLPLVMVTLIPHYHKGDLIGFSAWADCLETFGTRVYEECLRFRPLSPLNYPALGLFLSGGIVHALRSLAATAEPAVIDKLFRYYIAVFASLDFLLLAWLARLMGFRHWAVVGLVLVAAPSTVVGGMLWGQLDGASLAFCLLTFIGFLKAWETAEANCTGRVFIWLLLTGLSLTFLLLLKPLNTFLLPFFVFLAILTVPFLVRTLGKRWIVVAPPAAVVTVIIFRVIDSVFSLPARYLDSTFWYSWTGDASPHAEVISGNGFNLWVLLGRDMWSSSRIPFTAVMVGHRSFELTPFQVGIILYGLLLTLLCTIGFVSLSNFWNQNTALKHHKDDKGYLIPILCLLLALTQVGFNVFLTGTHERYLFLGYPFLLIATLWLACNHVIISWRAVIVCFALASTNAIFVYGAMHPLPGWMFPFWNNAFQATLHLVLLMFLFDLWLRLLKRYRRFPGEI